MAPPWSHSGPCPACPALSCSRITFLGSGLLLLNYAAAVTAAVRLPAVFNPWTMGLGHALLGAVLLYQTVKLDAAKYSQQAIKGYYAAVWCAPLPPCLCSSAGVAASLREAGLALGEGLRVAHTRLRLPCAVHPLTCPAGSISIVSTCCCPSWPHEEPQWRGNETASYVCFLCCCAACKERPLLQRVVSPLSVTLPQPGARGKHVKHVILFIPSRGSLEGWWACQRWVPGGPSLPPALPPPCGARRLICSSWPAAVSPAKRRVRE